MGRARTTLLFVRHAQSHPLPGQADADWALSERGVRQAAELVPVLRTLAPARVFTSPYRRCRETIAPFVAAAGVPCAEHAGLRERRIAPDGVRDFAEIWRRSWADFSFALDGCEDSWTCQRRMAATVDELVRAHAGERLALVSHGNAIGLFLNQIDPAFGVAEASALRTPELVVVEHEGERFTIDRRPAVRAALDGIATDFRATPGVRA